MDCSAYCHRRVLLSRLTTLSKPVAQAISRSSIAALSTSWKREDAAASLLANENQQRYTADVPKHSVATTSQASPGTTTGSSPERGVNHSYLGLNGQTSIRAFFCTPRKTASLRDSGLEVDDPAPLYADFLFCRTSHSDGLRRRPPLGRSRHCLAFRVHPLRAGQWHRPGAGV